MRQILLLLVINCVCVLPGLTQYTDITAMQDLGGPTEFARRRDVLMATLKDGYALLFANTTYPPTSAHYREDNDFYYFTGIQDPGAVLFLDMEHHHSVLFEPEQLEVEKQFFGPNILSLSEARRNQLGFSDVRPLSTVDDLLSLRFADSGEQDLWLRLGFGDEDLGARSEVGRDDALRFRHPYGMDLPGDREIFQRLRKRYPNAHLRDMTPYIDRMRNIKTPSEIEVLRRNGQLSAAGQARAIAAAHPGIYEYQLEAEAEYAFHSAGAQGLANPAIASSGPNVNTWHYFEDRRQTEPNDLVVLDYAADLDHMAMDITRTFNVSGRFTDEQARWYTVELAAQKAIIETLRPGNTYEQAYAAGKIIFDKAGVQQKLLPFPGHFLGLAQHDPLHPTGIIRAGQVLTVEPILDFPDKHLLFRIEDTVLITEKGPEVLSAGVPKELEAIEDLVGSKAGPK